MSVRAGLAIGAILGHSDRPGARRTSWVPSIVAVALGDMGSAVSAEIPISAPGVLDRPGATYVLTRDVWSPGTCFVIKGDDITLDLDGHRVTYGTQAGDLRFGVVMPTSYSNPTAFPDLPENAFGGANRFRLLNGTIVQGAGNGGFCHAVHVRGGRGIEIEKLTVRVAGPDTADIFSRYSADLRIHDCTLHSDVKVVSDRHYPGQDVIVAWDPTGDVDIHDNKVLGGAQWGIRVEAPDPARQGDLRIYRNEIRHDSKTTNGYGIGCRAPYLEVYDNVIIPRAGRGIHVSRFGCQVYRNRLEIREAPNPEYPVTRAHGIKMEGARRCRVYENSVVCISEPGFGHADALDLELAAQSFNEIYNNTFHAIRKTEGFWAAAVVLYNQEDGSGTIVRDNVFSSNHVLFRVDWDGGSGVTFSRNTFRFVEEPNTPRAKQTILIYLSTQEESLRNRFIDCRWEGGASPHDVSFLYSTYRPDQVELVNESTLSLLVRDAEGQVAAGADVRIADSRGRQVFSGTTSESGRAEATLAWFVRTPAGETVEPFHAVRISRNGRTSEFTFRGSEGPKVWEVELGSNTPIDRDPIADGDDEAPRPPQGVGVTLE